MPAGIELLSLDDIGCHEDIPETANTIAGNARLKAQHVKEHYGMDCFADDTGLEVNALDGAPGVYSARYAGPGNDSLANMDKLLSELEGTSDRSARFLTVMALYMGDSEQLFEGICNGSILEQPRGDKGFGYDPVFLPDGYLESFAQMSGEQKGAISHRGRALALLIKHLESL